jgi:L-iditol 2-dehydrogenase
MVEPLSSCINAQEKGGGVTGKEVVIFGAGPIGCLHTALARANHAKKIFVVDHNPSRLNLAEEMGADYLIDNSQPNVGEQIRLLTQGKGADLAIIAAPSPDALLNGIQVAKKGGVILLFAGFPNDQAIFSVDFNLIHYQGLKIIGTTIFSPYHFQQSLDLISSKLIDIEKMITRYSLLDFSNAVQSAFERKIGKAILLP